MRQVEASEWWLWGFAVTVTLVLTAGIVALTYPGNHLLQNSEWLDLKEWVRGLACLVLLFDVYTVYQQLQLQRIRRELTERNQLCEVITENAADMIAVIDGAGNRLYNSPSYQKVLGYSPGELQLTSSVDQIAFCATSYTNSEDIVRDAEIGMYRAKRKGKARCQVFDHAMHTSAVTRLRLETDLRRALELGEFRVHY